MGEVEHDIRHLLIEMERVHKYDQWQAEERARLPPPAEPFRTQAEYEQWFNACVDALNQRLERDKHEE